MTRIDNTQPAPPARPAPPGQQGGVARESGNAAQSRRFERALASAARRDADDGEPAGGAAEATVDPNSVAPCPAQGEGRPDLPQSAACDAAVFGPLTARTLIPTGEWYGSGEGTDPGDVASMSSETLRLQATPAGGEPASPVRASNADAVALAQSLMSQLPLLGAQDRSVTVSFTAPGAAVEQIVLTVSGGVVSLVVTARARERDRVAASLPELERLLRTRGVRIGAVGVA
jgi:hypothetical protein